ncbi:MAG: hypothetical protein ACK53L_24000, partial [Pirellulaceae bacterium]
HHESVGNAMLTIQGLEQPNRFHSRWTEVMGSKVPRTRGDFFNLLVVPCCKERGSLIGSRCWLGWMQR